MLPFIFAASAVQDGDTVTMMLFHDAVFMAVEGVGATLVPVGPPNRYEDVAAHPNVTLWACRPCVDARGLSHSSLDKRIRLGGMNEFHAAAKRADTQRVWPIFGLSDCHHPSFTLASIAATVARLTRRP